MTIKKRWSIGVGVVAIVVGLLLLATVWWLPSDEELALKFSTAAQEALGVEVSVGSVHWSLFPTPAIFITDLRTRQARPVTIGKLSAYPRLSELLHGELVLQRLEVDGATVPRNSVHALHAKHRAIASYSSSDVPLQRLAFRDVTWISYSGIETTYDGEIDFDPQWRPRHAELRRPGIEPPFTLTLAREAEEDRWQVHTVVGGGTAHGYVALKTTDSGAMHLSGQLTPHGIEVASAIRAFNRRSPVSGKGSGQTVLSADGSTFGELTQSLHTQTQFTVSAAALLRFDLDKAISTRGKEHDGQTPLQELVGQLDTQNGPEGMRVSGTHIRARTGRFTATGQGTLYHSQIDASGNLDIVEGAIGVPFTLSGSVHKPKVSVPPGFFAGAAIGTAVLPVIGTAIGARIGGAIGKLFNGEAKTPESEKKATLPK